MTDDRSKLAKAVDAIQELHAAGDLSFRQMALKLGLDPRRDFRGADLRGVDFSYEDLTDFDFRGADLTGANLYKAQFKMSALAGARITSANIPDVIWLRPRWSAFAPEASWTLKATSDVVAMARVTGREYLEEACKLNDVTALTAPVRWLRDAEFLVVICADAHKNIRQAFYLHTPTRMWSLGGYLEREKNWQRTTDLDVDAENVLEYLALHMYLYSQALLITQRGLDDIQIFGRTGPGVDQYLHSFIAEPTVTPEGADFRITSAVLGVGTSYPVSATVNRMGRVRFDTTPVTATQTAALVISPDEDPDALFADWASRR